METPTQIAQRNVDEFFESKKKLLEELKSLEELEQALKGEQNVVYIPRR